MRVLFTFVMALCASAAWALPPSDARLESTTQVWSGGAHNAFTDLVWYEGAFYATFREASMHNVPALGQAGGIVRLVRSTDGVEWNSAATFSLGATNHDLRDPKLTITPDHELMLLATDVPHSGSGGTRQSYTWRSLNGTNWNDPVAALNDQRWLWRVEWNPANDAAYGISYNGNSTRLHVSPTGNSYGTLVPTLIDGNEGSLLFPADGSAIALVRREGAGAQVAVSTNLTDWNFRDTGVFVGGPDMIQIPDGRIIVGGRFRDNFTSNLRTSLGWLDPVAGTIQEFLTFPSGGDTGYPGFAWHDDKLWVSYYSSHAGSTRVYLASVSFGNRTDTFSRNDALPTGNSLGFTEAGSFTYVERGNTAAQAIPNGIAQISGGRLLVTGSGQGTPLSSNTGGAYLDGFDQADLSASMDVGFRLAGAAPSGIAGADSNRFNNNFLLMLRSREGQNFGSNNALENGLVAVELGPNGDLLIREQTGVGASGLSIVRSGYNYFTDSVATREPLPRALPATFGYGTVDSNQNGYLDSDETVQLSVELFGTSLKVFINGVQYGPTFALSNSSAAAGQANGLGLHKNRLGSSANFLEQVVSDVLVDNLNVQLSRLALHGDYNGDGIVDEIDYNVWKSQFGLEGAREADGNLDGRVDAADYAIWRDKMLVDGSDKAAAVPEPEGYFLIAGATVYIWLSAQRFRGSRGC
ncbi:MAG: dockerin type I domain-containing protein [Pirellulales bacterium]